MIYGYIRVSTDKQTVENQRFEINKFIKKTQTSSDNIGNMWYTNDIGLYTCT